MIMDETDNGGITTTTTTTTTTNYNENIVDNPDESDSKYDKHEENNDEIIDKDDDDEWIDSIVESQWQDMVEIGLVVKWPLLKRRNRNNRTSLPLPESSSSCSMIPKNDDEFGPSKMQGGQHSSTTTKDETEEDEDNAETKTCSDQYYQDRHHKPLVLSTQLSHTQLSPLFDGTAWAGTRVWKAALLAIQYLEQRYYLANNDIPNLPSNKKSIQSDPSPQLPPSLSLLELGCGLGVPGMVWHTIVDENNSCDSDSDDKSWCKKNRVVLTDMEGLVPQLQANISQNFGDGYNKNENETDNSNGNNDVEGQLTISMIEALPLDWSTEDGIQQLLDREVRRKKILAHNKNGDDQGIEYDGTEPIFDIVLNCDCIYEPLYGRKAWEDLADLLAVVAQRSPRTLIVTSVERRNHDGLDNFMDRFARNMQQAYTGLVPGEEGTTRKQFEGCQMDRVVRDDSDPHHVIEIYTTRGCNWLST